MEKKTKKKEPNYGNFPPSRSCSACEGRGEVEDDYIVGGLFGPSSHWTYKKCTSCDGTGKNVWSCMWCGNAVNNNYGFWCPNENCEKYAINVALASKRT